MNRKVLALTHGLICHALFAIAVPVMFVGFATGLTSGLGPFRGDGALLANGLLIAQFPLVHSFLLSRRGRSVYRWFAPATHARRLAPTLYSSLASLQVLLLFGLWSPMSTTSWVVPDELVAVCWTLYGTSWLLLGKSMLDAGLALQTGAIGWLALYQDRDPDYGGLPTDGLFAFCRQPIYLSFALITWTSPVWTWDRLLVAGVLTAYCVFGPILKERRFARIHGEAFEQYRRRVPYLPRLRFPG